MSSKRPTLAAASRTITGKKVAALRAAGRLPAVVYGHGIASENISIDAHEFELLRRRAGANTLIDLAVDGHKPRPVLVHGVGRDHGRGRAQHVDLFAVRMTEELTAEVRLVPTGESDAIKFQGGTLLHVTETIKVRALPDHVPDSIAYPLESLTDFDAMIHVRDLVIPSDMTLLTDPDEIVAKVIPPRVEVEEAAAATEAAAPAEAAEAASSESGGE